MSYDFYWLQRVSNQYEWIPVTLDKYEWLHQPVADAENQWGGGGYGQKSFFEAYLR